MHVKFEFAWAFLHFHHSKKYNIYNQFCHVLVKISSFYLTEKDYFMILQGCK